MEKLITSEKDTPHSLLLLRIVLK